jgi:molecular chaperone GrpE
LTEDLAKEKDKYLRLFAEFENYKEELQRAYRVIKTANKSFIGYAACFRF